MNHFVVGEARPRCGHVPHFGRWIWLAKLHSETRDTRKSKCVRAASNEIPEIRSLSASRHVTQFSIRRFSSRACNQFVAAKLWRRLSIPEESHTSAAFPCKINKSKLWMLLFENVFFTFYFIFSWRVTVKVFSTSFDFFFPKFKPNRVDQWETEKLYDADLLLIFRTKLELSEPRELDNNKLKIIIIRV